MDAIRRLEDRFQAAKAAAVRSENQFHAAREALALAERDRDRTAAARDRAEADLTAARELGERHTPDALKAMEQNARAMAAGRRIRRQID